MCNVGVQGVDIHSDHNRFRGDKMVYVMKSSKKSSVSAIRLGILRRRGWRMESTHPEICSVCVLFEDAIDRYIYMEKNKYSKTADKIDA